MRRANVEVIVTFNLADFPESSSQPYDVLAVHPDGFLPDQLDLYPGQTIQVLGVAIEASQPELLPRRLSLHPS